MPEGDRKGGETLRQAASRIASDRLGLRINTEDWQHLGEEGEGGSRTQNWVVYQEEQINLDGGAAQEVVRVEEQIKEEDSIATKWVEILRFYMMLLTGQVITGGQHVGIPFRDLLRTRFPSHALGAKNEMLEKMGHTTEHYLRWMNMGLTIRVERAEASLTPAQSYSDLRAVVTLRKQPGQEAGRSRRQSRSGTGEDQFTIGAGH